MVGAGLAGSDLSIIGRVGGWPLAATRCRPLEGLQARKDWSRLVEMKPTLIAAEPVSAYDAKTHLPRLLERAEQGQRFVITRHGRPVAQLIPFEPGDAAGPVEAIQRVAAIRLRLQREGVSLQSVSAKAQRSRELAHDGHRY
jgi:prevent-host-death family protein